MRVEPRLILIPLLTTFLAACGGSQKKAAQSTTPVHVDDEEETEDDMEMMQEFGGMNEEKVTKVFKGLAPRLADCLTSQSADEPYLAGDVAFLVKVDRSGHAIAAHAEKSNLGSYAAESCMLEILKGAHWPKPVGGLIGLARWSIGFDAPSDVRPPVDWSESDASSSLSEDKNQSALQQCGSGGPFEITAYVAPSGKVLSAGIAHVDDQGQSTAECLVEAVRNMTFTSPGSWRAKVTFAR
ncbi:MAG TPA: hypothetical protein VN764_17125 [Polyangiaceae bacterium]|nr:hypothetical protein [Polyangiaceae bacterium]